MTESLNLASRKLEVNRNEVVRDSGKADDKNSSESTKSKNVKFGIAMCTNIGTTGKSTFLITNAKKSFNQLKQAFTKVPILQYFDLKYHIQI